ncbi:hypothetical protein ADK67_31070 [Saccharothrix sp. NRRL B-16348]|uniref:hypothetical protein n=1 Tax=Saccharothrix sp. NRRL B-16348 TaxID=1415542 RepID=UPI0006AE6AD9|nr:hypothetical protein [Saccharothrix sp. NRRL B-16348]KOX20020.1 hypothetical protein ADK67_31070 [Saccharothrix sp. NRRL B-16348]
MELASGVDAVLWVLGAVVLAVVSFTAVRTALAASASTWAHHAVRLAGTAFGWVGRRVGDRAGERAIAVTAPVCLLAVLVTWQVGWQVGVVLVAAPADVADVGRTALVVLFGALVVRTGQAHTARERRCGEFGDGRGAEELLAGYLGTGGREDLDRVLADWSTWLAELHWAHRAWPVLLYTRSSGTRCWLETVVTMLDVAALAEAIAPDWTPPHTAAVLVNGTDCIGRALVATGTESPRSTISLHGREDRAFDDTVSLLVAAGLPVERDPVDAWTQFQTRRTGYAPAASALAVRLLHTRFEERR